MNYHTHSWSEERFYWAVLETEQSGGQVDSKHARLRLDGLLETHLPVPAESVHAVYASLGDGRVMACAIERTDLASVPTEWIALTPKSLPPFLSDLQLDPSVLNVLVRDFEPRVYRHAARRRTLIACSAMILCTLLICVGWMRRVQAAADLDQSIEHEVVQAANHTLGGGDHSSGSEAQAAIDRALDRSTMLASSGRDLATFDAATALQDLLAQWPHNDEVTVQNLSVTQVSVSVNIDIRGDAQAFLKSITLPTNWKLEEPRLSTSNGTSRVSLVFRPGQKGGVK